MSSRPPRSTPERASLIGSVTIVLVVVALIVVQIPGDDRPAAPTVRVDQIRQVGEAFHVDGSVCNRGDGTAAQVQVTADLTLGDATLTAEQTIDFLGGVRNSSWCFSSSRTPRPATYKRQSVTGYAVP